jgi:transcriptional regulator with XRE-family HTH domain
MTKTTTRPDIDSIKAAFADVWGSVDDFETGLDSVKIDVSVMLCSLLEKADISRGQLAEKLGWKPSRVTRVLSGDENLTLKTIFEVCHAAGMTYDVVVRKINEHQVLQPWQKAAIHADIVEVRKTLNHRLNEAQAILDIAKLLSKRQFELSAEWRQKPTRSMWTSTLALAANDEVQDAALAS